MTEPKHYKNLEEMVYECALRWSECTLKQIFTEIAEGTVKAILPERTDGNLDCYDDAWNKCRADMNLRAKEWLGEK